MSGLVEWRGDWRRERRVIWDFMEDDYVWLDSPWSYVSRDVA